MNNVEPKKSRTEDDKILISMNATRVSLLVFASLLFTCRSSKVLETENVEGFQLNQYQTFDFFKLEASGDTSSNFQANATLIKNAITRNLESRGLKRVDTNPDLLINIGIVVKEETQTRQTTIREAPRYMGQRTYSWKSEEIEVGKYRTGTATVHLVDADTKTMMWRGVIESIIPEKKEKVAESIEDGVDLLFANL